ncbi:hypothetical protein LPJ59_002822 [Coemansia sp. RSA 2399]|nr:hypothetical protein LPJ59_002822 [Coemansia sp. RSA 2399]KAJ1904472.1 hypothetical protein LPJ81_002474 [Coemansia sp. IMI 209127]
MSLAPLTTSAGCVAELRAELKDHEYGLRSFTALEGGSGPQASAEVELLEGVHVTVVLDASGYTVAGSDDEARRPSVGRTFETLTGLLAAVSAGFNSAMHQSLSAKLIQAMADDSRLAPDTDEE